MKNLSQEKVVLKHLEDGKGISGATAFSLYGCMRLADRVHTLRNKGHEIFGKMVRHAKKRYMVYYTRQSPHFSIYGESMDRKLTN